jgi:hypothetical protein
MSKLVSGIWDSPLPMRALYSKQTVRFAKKTEDPSIRVPFGISKCKEYLRQIYDGDIKGIHTEKLNDGNALIHRINYKDTFVLFYSGKLGAYNVILMRFKEDYGWKIKKVIHWNNSNKIQNYKMAYSIVGRSAKESRILKDYFEYNLVK